MNDSQLKMKKKKKSNWVWSFEIKEICILKFPGIFNQMRITFFRIFMTWRLHFEHFVLCFTFCVSWNTFCWTIFGFSKISEKSCLRLLKVRFFLPQAWNILSYIWFMHLRILQKYWLFPCSCLLCWSKFFVIIWSNIKY